MPFDQTTPEWFSIKQPTTFNLMFRARSESRFKEDADPMRVGAEMEIVNLTPGNGYENKENAKGHPNPLNGMLWNILTTNNLINCDGYTKECHFADVHNTYVQTNFIKMIVELSENRQPNANQH